MDGYIYETHLHTCEASACGKVTGSDYIEYMKNKGYQGIIVTDHFFNGNSCVPKDLPWKERVAWYASGFKKALAAAEGVDFDVFFGVEFNFKGDEYLLYGVDEEWLADNEDLLEISREELHKRVHEAGAVMVQAHPYRDRSYISEIHLDPKVTDAVEIFNSANPDNENALAYRYAKELKVPMTGGSDIHFFHDDPLGGMRFDRKLKDAKDYGQAVLRGEGEPVRIHEGKVTRVLDHPELMNPTEEPVLPIVWL